MTSDLIKHNPMLKKPLLTILSLSEKTPGAERTELEQAALEIWDDAFSQSPTVAIDVLVRNAALDEQIFADGHIYDGTVEDMQLDENMPEGVVVESRLTITAVGRELLEKYAVDTTLRVLLEEKPQYAEVYEAILRECDKADGCDRVSLERVINDFSWLQPDSQTQQTTVYPQYFIDSLETAGGIVWQGSWRTTDAGKAILLA